MEERGPQVATEAHGDTRTKANGQNREQHLDQRHSEHHQTQTADVSGVATRDALVDDVGVESGKQEPRHGLDGLKDDDHRENPSEGLQRLV